MEKEFLIMSAPMEDNSDNALRTLHYRHGADLTFTEMIRVKALAQNNKSTWSRLAVYDDTPTEVQLLVSNEKDLEVFLKKFKPFPGFKGFNINLGCPSRDVVNAGLGSAMIKRTTKIEKLIDLVRKYNHPVSIKSRLGGNNFEKQNKVYLKLIENTTPDYFIIHLRHAWQKYSEASDWNVIPEILKFANERGKKVVINGDVHKKEQIDYLKKLGAHGAMIARASVYDPSIFSQLKGGKKLLIEELRKEYLDLAAKYNTPPRFKEQVLMRMGRDVRQIDANLLI
jgi:tRNA-dihydrouridine synthase B